MRSKRLIWITVLAIVAMVAPWLMPNDYYVQVLVYAVIYSIAAMGINFIYGFTGYISFAQAAFFGIGSYTSALLSVDYHWPALTTWIAVIIVSAVFGVLLGLPSLRLRGHYLALATIGFTFVVQMVLTNWTSFTHGAKGINNIPTIGIGRLQATGPIPFYYVTLFVIVLLFLVQHNIIGSKIGRSFKAIREDEISASSLGIGLIKMKVWAFIWSAVYGGLAGALFAQFSAYISPDTYSFNESIMFFTMTLVGGAGTLAGPIVGGVSLTFLPELLRFIKEYYMAVYGLLIILVVLFMPQGIVPMLPKLWQGKWWKFDNRKGSGKKQDKLTQASITEPAYERKVSK